MFWVTARLLLLGFIILAFGHVTSHAQSDDVGALNRQVVALSRQGNYAKATKIAKRALAIAEQKSGPDNPVIATSLNNLAGLYQSQGRYAAAEPLYKRSLALYERALGPDHPDVATSLNNLALLYQRQGRYAAAEPLYKRSLDLYEKALEPDHPDIAMSLNNLAFLYQRQGRNAEAEPLYKRSLALYERALGPAHPDVGQSLNNLAGLYQSQGSYAAAEPLYKRSLAIREIALGPVHPDIAMSLNNLALLYQRQGRNAEAEPLYKRSLALYEKALGPDHPEVGQLLDNLAGLYQHQGRYVAAEPLYKRSLAIREKALGPDHSAVGQLLNNLALLYQRQGRHAAAEPLYKRSLAIYEKALGPAHPEVATSLNNLALLYLSQGRYAAAEPLYKRSFAIYEKALGPDHPQIATTLINLAALYWLQSRYADAEPLYKRSLAIREKALRPDHPDVGQSLSHLAALYRAQNDWKRATGYYRRSAAVIARRARRGTQIIGRSLTGKKKSEVARSSFVFAQLVKSAHRLTQQNNKASIKIAPEMFQAAQWASGSEAAAALAQMAARQTKGGGDLARLVRARQDLVAEWQKRDALRSAAVSQPPAKRNHQAETKNVTRLAAIDSRIANIDKRLAADFPDYATLSNPQPLTIAEVQKQLKTNEALVLFLDTVEWKPTPEETFIWVVTRTASRWLHSGMGTAALTKQVGQLRRTLDPTAGGMRGGRALGTKATGGFDRKIAHQLYNELLAPAEDLLKDKSHLIVVPSGALTALPFHVLLTEPPSASRQASLRSAPWLIRRHAITTLPSVASLGALRRNTTRPKIVKDYVGFANPVFGSSRIRTASVDAKRGFAGYFRGTRGDVSALSDLNPLPDTEDEVRAISKLFGARADIYFGKDVNEGAIKRLPLGRYRVVHFATHGLIAGEVSKLAEPALALSVPAAPSDADDGLLTASEVTTLKLNAEWVILSACNTAAGDRPGAEALSGLARAFFYAGTRALLVSHWPVVSSAAVKLTTKTFAQLRRAPALGRSEALRRAMLDIIDNGTDTEAHPSYWAPFVVVGEGAQDQ
jgi:CHAT domain-containing protein/Tfp pilus assembly protein PilF